jgi:hypothetical protein
MLIVSSLDFWLLMMFWWLLGCYGASFDIYFSALRLPNIELLLVSSTFNASDGWCKE